MSDVLAHAYKDGELAVKVTNEAFIPAFEESEDFEVKRL